jgi:hypothetical protein
MKIKTLASILMVLALNVAVSRSATAQSASGTYQFSLEDGYTKYVEFDAQMQADGTASGRLYLSDEATLYSQDLDGTGEAEERYPGFYIKADVDGMVVTQNQAVMSGTVTDSSLGSLIGQRVLLTVVDNGDNTREPDQLTWGVYQPVNRNWTPSDAELEEDPGVGLRWEATDAEIKDDQPIQMPRDEAITAQSFPLTAYAFVEVAQGAGDIRVEP